MSNGMPVRPESWHDVDEWYYCMKHRDELAHDILRMELVRTPLSEISAEVRPRLAQHCYSMADEMLKARVGEQKK